MKSAAILISNLVWTNSESAVSRWPNEYVREHSFGILTLMDADLANIWRERFFWKSMAPSTIHIRIRTNVEVKRICNTSKVVHDIKFGSRIKKGGPPS